MGRRPAARLQRPASRTRSPCQGALSSQAQREGPLAQCWDSVLAAAEPLCGPQSQCRAPPGAWCCRLPPQLSGAPGAAWASSAPNLCESQGEACALRPCFSGGADGAGNGPLLGGGAEGRNAPACSSFLSAWWWGLTPAEGTRGRAQTHRPVELMSVPRPVSPRGQQCQGQSWTPDLSRAGRAPASPERAAVRAPGT